MRIQKSRVTPAAIANACDPIYTCRSSFLSEANRSRIVKYNTAPVMYALYESRWVPLCRDYNLYVKLSADLQVLFKRIINDGFGQIHSNWTDLGIRIFSSKLLLGTSGEGQPATKFI